MERHVNETSVEEQAKWVKRLLEASHLLAKAIQETVPHGTSPRFDVERTQNVLKEGKHEGKQSRFDDP